MFRHKSGRDPEITRKSSCLKETKKSPHVRFYKILHFNVFKVFSDVISIRMFSRIDFRQNGQMLKPTLHTPTLSADFWSSPSKIKQNLTSMQCLPRFWKIFELFTEFDPILAWILLGNFEKFVSADKTGVCKSGLRPMFTFTRNEWKLFTVFTTTSVDWKKKRSNSIGQMWRNGWKSWACFNFFARDFRGGLTFSISKDG